VSPADERAAPASGAEVAKARERLDAWVREVVAWHFDPASGCPFWLEFARKLGWDPRREVRGFADLARFPPFQDEWLRGGPLERWVPRGLEGRPIYVFEAGGGTGAPQYRISSADFRTDYEMFSATLPEECFPPGSDWISMGPTGPRRLRLAVEHLAQVRGGICFIIDMDPGWVLKCTKRGWMEVLEAYKTHVVDQTLTLIKAHPNIRCLFTTPKLLEALCEKISLRQAGISGVLCEGTQMTAEFHRRAREELLEGAAFVPSYGNPLMGLAGHKPFVPEDEHAVTYHAPQPRAVLEVVDSAQPARLADYGESGRVKLTALTKEFFVPGFLERDQAERTRPIALYPWDGVRNVRPFVKLGSSTAGGAC
jgi:hypothetical protein